MALPSTSGTIGTIPYRQQAVMDHAFRRAGFLPQKIASEALDVAKELLLTLQDEWINAGVPLWTIYYKPLAIRAGSPDVVVPDGTVDVLNAFWRIINPYRGPCTLSSGAGNSSLFAGQAGSDVTIPSPNPSVTVNFTSDTEVDGVGILMGGTESITTALRVYTSEDGSTWTLAQTLDETTFVPGTWAYFDLNPSHISQYIKIEYFAQDSWTLAQMNLVLANSQDIAMGVENIDSYYNLTNRAFRSDRPNTVYVDRQIALKMKIWPTPNDGAFYNGTITALLRRYIQDPGSMTEAMEIPRRWVEAMQWRLAVRIMDEIPEDMAYGQDAQPELTAIKIQDREARYKRVTANCEKAEALAWSEERNRSPIRLMPSLRAYTA